MHNSDTEIQNYMTDKKESIRLMYYAHRFDVHSE